MLGKLIKYEWKSVSKICSIVLLALVGATALGTIYYLSPLWANTIAMEEPGAVGENVLSLLMGISSLIGYMLIIIGAVYGVYIYLLVRFYRSMYTDEGYLSHTLPVTPSQLILSKLLVNGIWGIIIEWVVGLSVILTTFVFVRGLVHVNMGEFFAAINWSFEEVMGINFAIYCALVVLTSLIEVFSAMSLYFCGITLGQLAKSHRGIMAIVGCFGVVIVNMIVSSSVQMIATLGNLTSIMQNRQSSGMTILPITSFATVALANLAMGIGAYFLTRYIVSKKLNLS